MAFKASSPSAVRESPLEAAVGGSWLLPAGVLVFEGAFPLALRGWWPPLLRARGSPLASLRAMVLSQWAWQGHCHSSEGEEKNRKRKKFRLHLRAQNSRLNATGGESM